MNDANIMFYENTKPMSGFREYFDKKNDVYQKVDERLDYRVGSIVRWFKRDGLSDTFKATNQYLYKIIAFANNNETGELMVIFMSLYGNFSVHAERLEFFKSKVNKEEYSYAQQEYRYEVVKYHTDNGEGVNGI